jgi:hypothetical protein
MRSYRTDRYQPVAALQFRLPFRQRFRNGVRDQETKFRERSTVAAFRVNRENDAFFVFARWDAPIRIRKTCPANIAQYFSTIRSKA